MLWPMGLQRVRPNLVTEQQQRNEESLEVLLEMHLNNTPAGKSCDLSEGYFESLGEGMGIWGRAGAGERERDTQEMQ